MGLTDREYYRDEAPTGAWTGGRSVLMTLVIVNVALLVSDLLFGGPAHRIVEWLSLRPSDLVRPWLWWRLVTYGFVHDPEVVGHIVLNLFVLWMFGRNVEGLYGHARFLRFYLTAIVLGGIAWALRWMFLPSDDLPEPHLIGASGAVTAVLLLFIYHFPRRTILLFFVIPVPAWVLGVLYVLGDLAGMQGARSDGWLRVAYDVHLCGAAWGLAYGFLGSRVDAAWTALDVRRWWRRGPRLRVRTAAEEEKPESGLAEQADAILDKVQRQGIDSLTPRERRILELYSRQLRQRGL